MKINRENAIVILFNLLFIAWCAFCLFGCATKKKTVEVSKSETEQSGQFQAQSKENLNIQSSNESSALTAFDFGQIMGKWSLGYDGQMGEGFRFYMNQTESGWEAGAEGKGTAQAEAQTTQINSRLEVRWQERFDSLANFGESRFAGYESRIKSLEKQKNVEKESTGFQAGVYIIGGIAIIVLIFCCWLGWQFRNLRNSVRVLNSV